MIKVGKIVNTHGIKGELRILSGSSFSLNDFLPEYKHLYIDGKKYVVSSYRFHKKFHQVVLKGFNSINDVEFLKGKDLYVKKLSNKTNDFESYIGMGVYQEDKKLGEVISISQTKLYKILVLDSNLQIPITKNFIKKISGGKIIVKNL